MDPRLMIGPRGPQLTGVATGNGSKQNVGNQGAVFGDLFQQALKPETDNELRISAHANKRLNERNIDMSPALEMSLNKAISELQHKGARDSLIVTNEGAFVVNVPNRTLITAMSTEEMRDGIVTNIDSVNMKYQ